MFEVRLCDPGELRPLGDAALIDAITAAARATAAAEARQLAAIAELTRRRLGAKAPGWGCDEWDQAAAEVSCALTVKHGRAMNLMLRAMTLAEELPKVGALFLAGEITAWTAATIVNRTENVIDPEVRAQIDTDIAETITGWGPLSQTKLEATIDTVVADRDPDAVRRSRATVASRSITIGDPRDDGSDLTSIWGKLSITDAALLDATLNAMAKAVCEDDPRTLAQRRADAMGALAAQSDRLICGCDNPDCPAKTGVSPAARVTVTVVTNAPVTPAPRRRTNTVASPGPVDAAGPAGPAPGARPVAFVPGRAGGFISAEALAALIALGAKVRTVTAPGPDPERRYRPSTALDAFVRTRDLSCRWPGCDRPAAESDIDHSNPWDDGGHTHPSSLNVKCRLHHLIRTFAPGWSESQHPDGTLTITSPTGHSYTSKPLSGILFPDWNTTTAQPPPPGKPRRKRGPGRTLMKPARKRDRATLRAQRIKRERALNAAAIAAEDAAAQAAARAAGKPPPPGRYDPPPF